MPLIKTTYGGECPLGKFEAGPWGGYTEDPVEKCLGCNFADTTTEEFNLEKICQCPEGMTWAAYDKLREQYTSKEGKLTREGFQKFVSEKYAKRQSL